PLAALIASPLRRPPTLTVSPSTTLFRSWTVRVGMGAAHLQEGGRTVTVAGHRLPAVDVDLGNPHAVAFLPEQLSLEVLDLEGELDRKSTRLNSSHVSISYAVFCLKKKTS